MDMEASKTHKPNFNHDIAEASDKKANTIKCDDIMFI
jgi:hypothetical protein